MTHGIRNRPPARPRPLPSAYQAERDDRIAAWIMVAAIMVGAALTAAAYRTALNSLFGQVTTTMQHVLVTASGHGYGHGHGGHGHGYGSGHGYGNGYGMG